MKRTCCAVLGVLAALSVPPDAAAQHDLPPPGYAPPPPGYPPPPPPGYPLGPYLDGRMVP